jgi:hypothetical protein
MMSLFAAINSAKERAAQLGAVRFASRWGRAVPLKLWLGAGALIFAALWLHEHDARVRAAVEAQQMEQQTAREVAALQTQARTAIAVANRRNAAKVETLEKQRRKLAGRANELSAQLDALKRQQQRRTEEIAAMPPVELAQQLASRLGPSSVVRGPSQPSSRVESKATRNAEKEPAVGTPPLQRESARPVELTDAGARRVASALSDLDSCRAQSAIQAGQVSTCGQQLATDEAEIQTQRDSVTRLNQALAAKDRILSEREKEYQAQLVAARGTWRGRTWHALKMIGLGVGIGMVIR